MGCDILLNDETISAISTGYAEGGIGIVRISGKKAISIVKQIFRSVRSIRIEDVSSHSVLVGSIIHPITNIKIDEVIVLLMRAPKSYTCEDVIEIQCHGGTIPLRKILELTLEYGARMAEPGEFTKRAFLNGRIDLTQAEATIDVIRAKTDAALKVAVEHLAGNLSEIIKLIRFQLLELIAYLEVEIDFPDEDVAELSKGDILKSVKNVRNKISDLIIAADTGKILRDGLKTAIVGKPNVGKSSLLNALLREKRAIVTDIPGTTRDIIEEYINIQGIPVKIIDTAGIRDTNDTIEKIGIEKTKSIIDKADLILLLLDLSEDLTNDDIEILKLIKKRKSIVILNKSDLAEKFDIKEIKKLISSDNPLIKLSTLNNKGVFELEQVILNLVCKGKLDLTESALVTSVRHKDLLSKALLYLQAVEKAATAGMPEDCLVIDLRNAWEVLGEITGETVKEDIIDTIFSQFCIGK